MWLVAVVGAAESVLLAAQMITLGRETARRLVAVGRKIFPSILLVVLAVTGLGCCLVCDMSAYFEGAKMGVPAGFRNKVEVRRLARGAGRANVAGVLQFKKPNAREVFFQPITPVDAL